MDRINTAVFNATGTTTDLRKVLGADYGYAVSKGIADNLQNQLNHGNATSGDLAQQGLLDHQFYLAAAGNKDEQATAREFIRTLNPYDPNQWNLTQAQRRKYGGQLIAFKKNDAGTLADVTATGKVVDQAMFQAFGDLTHPEDSVAQTHRNQFYGMLQNSIQAWKASPNNKGKEPTQGDVQGMADSILLRTATGEYTFHAGPVGDSSTVVPPEDAAMIRQAYPNATDAQVRQAYVRTKAGIK